MRIGTLGLLAALALAGCKTTEQLAAEDHAQCVGMGAKPGGEGYFICRSWLAQQRAADKQAAAAFLLSRQAQTMPTPAAPVQKPVTCFPVGQTVQCW